MTLRSLGFLLMFAAGCAAPTSEDAGEASAGDALSNSKIKLPAGDECRDVLAPLALGLADGAVGLSYTKGITVSLTSATDTRVYAIEIAGGEEGPMRYEVELDNDSASMCLFESVKQSQDAKLERDRKTSASNRERNPGVNVSVSPKNDDCASTVKLLGEAVAISAVGAKNVVKVDVKLVGETEDRDYVAHVDGRSFVANGKTFPNDWDFAINVSNDSAFKCFVQDVHLGKE